MRTRIHAVVLPSHTAEFADDLRRLTHELDRESAAGGLNGECSPPLDVYETDDTLEIVMDLPGVDASSVRVATKGDAVLIAGLKPPRRGRGESSFHLVERGYGRLVERLQGLGARVARMN